MCNSKMEMKRISINLRHYFQDYRQLALVCIKKHMKVINDLKKHIANVFQIGDNFYLKCQNCYLPSLEDIHILNENDLIYVVPSNQIDTNDENLNKKPKKEKKKSVNSCDIITDINSKKENIQNFNHDDCNLETEKLLVDDKLDNITEESEDKGKKHKNKKKLKYLEANNLNIENTSHTEIYDKDVKPKSKKRRRCISPVEQNDNERNLQNLCNEIHSDQNETVRDSIVLSVEIVNKDKQKEYNEHLNQNNESCKRYTNNDVINFTENKIINNSNTKKKKLSLTKLNAGVGNIIKLLNSSAQEDSDQSQGEVKFITKRKRTRTRRSKRNQNIPEEKIEAEENPVFIPPRTRALPKSHIKFTNEDENENNTETNFTHSTPKCTSYVNYSVMDDESNLSITNIDTTKFSDLTTNSLPVNSLILFKKLKLNENYNPEVSNYILAKVKDVSENGEQLKLKLLDGHDEFKDPVGKFSTIMEEENSENSTVIVEKNDLIDIKVQNEI